MILIRLSGISDSKAEARIMEPLNLVRVGRRHNLILTFSTAFGIYQFIRHNRHGWNCKKAPNAS